VYMCLYNIISLAVMQNIVF